jgi:DNA-binding NarL/FixJ family response regulator
VKTSETTDRKTTAVWLVEDNENYSKTLKRAFTTNSGIVCARHFKNAEEMLEQLRAEPAPNVILLDVALPGMNGIDAIKLIRGCSPSVKILMLTVFEDEKKIFRAIHAGAMGYLLKTSTMPEIRASIEQVMADGAPMSPKVARSVLKMFSALPEPEQDYGLTNREGEILRLMTLGLVRKQIADQLHLSYHTVDSHIRNIFRKMSVQTSVAAVIKASRYIS